MLSSWMMRRRRRVCHRSRVVLDREDRQVQADVVEVIERLPNVDVLLTALAAPVEGVGNVAEGGSYTTVRRAPGLIPAGDRPGEHVELQLAEGSLLGARQEVEQAGIAANQLATEHF